MSILNFLKKDFNDFPKKAIEDPNFRASLGYRKFKKMALLKAFVLVSLGVIALLFSFVLFPIVGLLLKFSACCFFTIGFLYFVLGATGIPMGN